VSPSGLVLRPSPNFKNIMSAIKYNTDIKNILYNTYYHTSIFEIIKCCNVVSMKMSQMH
jgi:hypothetical protein